MKKLFAAMALILTIFFLVQCSTQAKRSSHIPLVSKSEIQRQTVHSVKVADVDVEGVYRDIRSKYRLIKNQESYKTLERLSKAIEGKGIPDDWRVKVSKPRKGEVQGVEFTHPNNDHIKVRVMPGDPKSSYPNSRKPYVKVQKDGKAYDKNGSVVEDRSHDSHIPIDDFDFSLTPWSKK